MVALLWAQQIQARRLAAIRRLSELYGPGREDDRRLDARIAAYELAFRMQTQASDSKPAARRFVNQTYEVD